MHTRSPGRNVVTAETNFLDDTRGLVAKDIGARTTKGPIAPCR